MKSIFKKIWLLFIIAISFFTSCEKDKNNSGLPVDGDGNFYDTVLIGSQVWLTENLKTTKFNNGTSIQLITDNTIWNQSKLPSFCWYKNDPSGYKDKFGALYNWYAGKLELLCPIGYHIPTKDEWTTLTDFMTTATESEKGAFKVIQVGWRVSGDGSFDTGLIGCWWISSPEYSEEIAYKVRTDFEISTMKKNAGYPVRCIKNK